MILDRRLYKIIEWHLYNYDETKRWLEEYKNDIINTSPPELTIGGGGSGQSHHSDPTALKTLKLTKKEVLEKEKWLQVIDKVRQHFTDEKGRLLNMKYEEELGNEHIAMELHIDRATYYRWRNEIVLFTAMLAQKYGLIDIEKLS